jgi:anti-anti-sigma factor
LGAPEPGHGDDVAGVPGGPGPLIIEAHDEDGQVIVVFRGEIDLEDAERISAALEEAVARSSAGVRVDLREATFLGSTGVRLLLEAKERAHVGGRAFAVVLGEGPARRVVELLELEERLEVVDARPAGSRAARPASQLHIDPEALAESIEGLGSIATGGSVEEDLGRVVTASQRLFAVTGAGMMLADPGTTLRYVVATDPSARVLETAQEKLGAGPCVQSFVDGQVVAVTDLETDGRWPGLWEAVEPTHVRAVLGVPTRLGGTPVGSLNVYRDTAYEWDESDVQAIESYNGLIETLLASAIAAQRRSRVVAQLQEALDRRVTIERAVGLLMGRHGLDAVRAFDLLRRTARDARRKVADVAAEVLSGGDVLDRPAGGPRG